MTDIGEPRSYLVLADGTPVYDRSGAEVGKVEHVLRDDQSDLFHGLVVETPDGHRFARAAVVDGIYERAVIITVPAAELPTPSEDPAAVSAEDEGLADGLRRAWDWLIKPR